MRAQTSPKRTRQNLVFSFSATLLISMIGCGPAAIPTSSITGKVLLKGKTVAVGVVSLESSETGYASSRKLESDGTFHIQEIPLGTYKVTVSPPSPPLPGPPMPNAPKPSPVVGNAPKIPEKYFTPSKSGLTVTVHAGENPELVLNLE